MTPMTIHEEQVNGATVVSLAGEVDSIQAVELENHVMGLLNRGVKDLLLDCSKLEYINSAGLRVFLLAAKQLAPGGHLAFCGLVPNVRLVFETIGFDRILNVYDTRATALARITAAVA